MQSKYISELMDLPPKALTVQSQENMTPFEWYVTKGYALYKQSKNLLNDEQFWEVIDSKIQLLCVSLKT